MNFLKEFTNICKRDVNRLINAVIFVKYQYIDSILSFQHSSLELQWPLHSREIILRGKLTHRHYSANSSLKLSSFSLSLSFSSNSSSSSL